MRKPLLGLFALLASVAPAFAGEVYVPYASNKNVQGTLYRTKVWVTNTGAAVQKFGVRFIEQGIDGTKVAPPTGSELSVPVGGTLLLTNVAPDGKSGMLEIAGSAQLVVNARIEATNPAGAVISSANVPVVSTGNVVKANATAHLQGLERTARGTITDFGLLNLTPQAMQCTIKAFRANGSQIAQTVALSLFPLSVAHFSEALVTLGEAQVSDARISVSCDKQFFTYALVFETGGPETSFVTPSGSLEGDLVAGGGGNTPGTVVYQVPGAFLNAKNGDSFKGFDLPAVEGARYKKATVEFDLFVNRFPGLFAGVHSFRRTDRTLYYGLIVRGGRKKTILDVDEEVITGSNGGPWEERTSYRVVFEYDTAAGKLVFRLFRNGAVVETLNGSINNLDLSTNGRAIRVDFGQAKVADGAYFPPVGWVYSNLKVTLEPAE